MARQQPARDTIIAHTITAVRDDSLTARVVRRVPLLYAMPAAEDLDRPPHVRAGSSLAWYGTRLAVVQDDANFLALVDVESGKARHISLPAGADGRRQFDDTLGNKEHKHDFEALVNLSGVHHDLLIALGSGSTPRREHIACLSRLLDGAPLVRMVHARALFERLRSLHLFSGSELNIEGAVAIGSILRLFGRGNGAPRDGRQPVNATCDVAIDELLAYLRSPADTAPPSPGNVARYDLGYIAEQRLTFTDAAVVPLHDASASLRITYTATAEASPDVTLDGEVTGSAIGFIDHTGAGSPVARWAPLVHEDGQRLREKAEGVAFHPTDATIAYVVLDSDNHHEPSELCEVRVQEMEPGSS